MSILIAACYFPAIQTKGDTLNIYAGNLSHDVTEEDLRRVFRPFGQVSFVNIIKNRYQTATPGFGIVEMPLESEAEAAISGLDGKNLKGRPLNVNDARPRLRPSPQE